MIKRNRQSRVPALILCLAMFLTLLPSAFAAAANEWENPFADVQETDWYYDAVSYMNTKDVFQGTSETLFSPADAMTRGMFVTALGRLTDEDVSGYTDSGFADVILTAYYAPYVAWAREKDYVNGTSKTTFSPEKPITREELATLLSRYLVGGDTSNGLDTSFALFTLPFLDRDMISSWAIPGVTEMYYAGIMTAVDDPDGGKYFYPKQAATRAEVAYALYRIDLYEKENGELSAGLTVARFLLSFTAGDADAAESFLSELLINDITQMGGIRGVLSYTGKVVEVTTLTGPAQQGGYWMFGIVLASENGVFDLIVTVGDSGLIEGLALLPHTMAEEPILMPSGFTEISVIVDAGEGFPLEGRAVLPDDTSKLVPAIVLVQGSGATDYDEIAGANRVFGQIAQGLAEQGIATLRYSKRNYVYPEITSERGYSVYDEYVRDVIAAVELAKKQPGVDPDRVYLLGHSQGGMLAPLFLDEGADAAGMILFAGTPRSLMDVLDDQQELAIEYYEANGMVESVELIRQAQEGWVAERKALELMSEAEALDADATVYDFPAYYMYILEHYSAIETIKKLKAPTLILQGSNDLQVYADRDFAIYVNEVGGEPYVETKLYDGLSHMFMPSVATDLMEALAEYNVQSRIPAEVFDDIAAWISAEALLG